MQPKTVMAEGRFLRMVRRGKWEYVQRVNITGIVLIVAVTDDGRLILTEQFRRTPVDARVIELPAGLAGDVAGAEDEALAEAARRELLEETGWAAERMEHLLDAPTTAGAMDEMVSFFRATGLRKAGAGGGDGSEDITVHEVELAGIEDFLRDCRARGLLVDAKVYAALWFARAR
jgi:ADP-ribose pyrophosphatase